MRLRQAQPGDAAAMHRLAEGLSGAAHWNLSDYETIFDPSSRKRVAFVVESDANAPTLKGFVVATCDSRDWEIENVVIDPKARRQGLGLKLVQAVTSAAEREGADHLLLEVRASNLPAIRLYEAAGFVQSGRRKGYYQSPEEDAFLMCKLFG